MTLRVFIGIELPSKIKHTLYKISESMTGQVENAKWVSPENIHLTLKFLGSIPEEKVDEIAEGVENAISCFRKFYFSLNDIGAFPNARRARVLWVGVHYGANELIEVSKSIEKAMAQIGFEPESKLFKPHITLARIKIPASIEENIAQISSNEHVGRIVNVDCITIFQSHLKRSGAEYEPIRVIPLPGTLD